ncbi:MAG: HAD hydrolase-like protein [bacterium]|uniref:HAD hydrolase-like protein n=1 Tax=Candidatus Methylomirabilis tolerans TaxID=3123416 RepID=A0AAJ1AHL1_9BACT|nr:HAD hydrolase-like protein [Candidatus Methylomirabilis sp.]
MENKARGILLDFDHTLFDTDRFFWIDLKSAFARFGVPDDAWEKSYEAIWPSGYSLAKHLEELARLGAVADPAAAQTMLEALESAFSDLRPYLFPDVLGFLDTARLRGFELILLSFGDPAWQSYKVRASGINPYFTQILYTAKETGKAALCAERASQYGELHAIDNNPTDLDAMKTSIPWLQTHLICRVEPSIPGVADPPTPDRFREAARYLTIPCRLPHHRCHSLKEVCLS